MRHLILLLTFSLAGCAYRGMVRTPFDVSPEVVAIPTDAEALDRGRYLVETVSRCGDCHNSDLAGEAYIDAFPMGTFAGPNITPGAGSVVAEYSDAEWVRAIRHGLAPDGRVLLQMPSDAFAALTVDDLGAMIAWLKQVPAVDRVPPETDPGFVGRMLVRKGDLAVPALTIDHSAPIPRAVGEDPVAHGAYLGTLGGCLGCHGEDLAGKDLGPGQPRATNITPHADGLDGWSEADFVRAMRNGVRPDDSQLDPLMPWAVTAGLTDADLAALWAWLQSVPPEAAPEK